MADFKERPSLSEDEENNIPLNQSQNSTKDKEILVEVVHEIQPIVPTEENATECGISPQSDNLITGKNGGVICDLLQDSRVPDPTFPNSSKTIIIPDENGSNESSEEKICSLVHNEEGANQTGEEDIFCDPCLYGDMKTKATHYCKTCDAPEPLCNDCAKQHTRQKSSRNHEICDDIGDFQINKNDLNANADQIDQEEVFCDPCLYGDIKTPATLYCKTCDDPEPLCNDCAKQHTRQKSNRDHELCDDMDEFHLNKKKMNANGDQTDQEVFCDPCLYGDIKTKATYYCKTCDDPEPLCNDCAKQHTRQKSNRDHELCDDMREFSNIQRDLNVNADQTDEEDVFCDPCLYGDIKTKATHYCNTCDDPEPLCNDCAKQHTRQKSSRDHELCDDMREFSNIQKDLNANTNKTDQEEVFCDPCLCDDIKTKATHYCKTCDDPEPLCNDCAKQHTRQKSNRDHELCDDMREFSNTQKDLNVNTNETDPEEVFCDPCLCDDIKTKATHYCKTCDDPEPLCNDCAKQHTRQKSSRNHELCDDMREFSNIQKDLNVNADQTHQGEVFCDPCLCGDIKSKATHYCTTCDDPEPLCNDCAKQHTRQKLSRDHELCDDLREFSNIPKKLNAKQVVKIGDQTDQEEVFCDPCLYGDIKTKATHYCKTCNVPEPLCNNCGTQHTRQKMSRDHVLCDDMGKFSNNQKDLNAKSFHINKLENTEKEEAEVLTTPGKPTASKTQSDRVDLFWSQSGTNVDYYQIRYKSRYGQEKWKIVETEDDQSQITITGLMANTTYVFQVRGVFQDQEGRYGCKNDEIQTLESLATHLKQSSIKVADGNPPTYQLLTEEIRYSRNDLAKTKQVVLGELNNRMDERTIMLVGATGSGKSTLVDGIVNYVMGVSFDDPFRFTLVQREDEENKRHNQAVSQTEWITVYKIAPQTGSRLDYTLSIIDTPGFGDTRGIKRDQITVDQIRHLFSETGAKGVLYIDAVCFIVKAPDARLSVSQQYIFSSIMSLFGKDIESNICTLITFADGAVPPVLASLKEAKLPFGSNFQFNNSALFADNKTAGPNSLSPMFWEMGCKSFQKFFEKLNHFQTRSLAQTKDVLKEREQLRTVIACIYPQIQVGLSKLSELRNSLEVFKKHKSDIENNKDFEYMAEETHQIPVKLEQGHHVTNCLNCNFTCHDDCIIADDENKRKCCAMKDGFCTVCIKKCEWSDHKNAGVMYKYNVVKVKKTYTEMKKIYEKAKGLKMTHKVFIEEITVDVDSLFKCVKWRMAEMKRCKCRLAEIALRPDPLSTVEYLDLMIQSEEMEKKEGYEKRIKMLHKFRHMASIDIDFENLGENLLSTKQELASQGISGGATKKFEDIFERGLDYVKELFSVSPPPTSPTHKKQKEKKTKK